MTEDKPKTPAGKKRVSVQDAIAAVFTLAYTAVLEIIGLVFWAVNIIIFFVLLSLRTTASVVHLFIVYVPRIVGRFVPPAVSMKLDQLLLYAGVGLSTGEVIGMTMVYSVIVSIITYLVAHEIGMSLIFKILAAFIAFIGVWITPKILLDALIYKRTQNIELVLPDILDIIAQNIKVGMTTDRALWSAARPEFGPLAAELQMAARATLTGTPLPDALIGVTNRIKSERLERTIRLIIQGITSGGELPTILQTIALDMRSGQNLVKQMKSETNAHVMFILFAILVGAPLLFAVSLQFIVVFSGLFSKLDIASLANLPQGAAMVMVQPFVISPEFYFRYALITLFVLSFFGSFLIGLLRTGRSIAGLQSIPVLAAVSIIVFMVLNHILTAVFGGAFVV